MSRPHLTVPASTPLKTRRPTSTPEAIKPGSSTSEPPETVRPRPSVPITSPLATPRPTTSPETTSTLTTDVPAPSASTRPPVASSVAP
ncbi:unnamed protein product [Aphanomyces euteiches]